MHDLSDRALGKYIILEEIGRGGMGAVYKARDVELDRIIAIKVLSPYLVGEPRLVQRFIREARLAANLDHPNIVTIYDIGGEGGYYFFAMKHLDGRPLKVILAERGPLPIEEVVSFTRQLASALDYAHEQNLIHRDVKPGNVMISADGHVTLTDFGLAKVAESLKLAASGEAIGTLEYMAPEQARGEVKKQSDIYSLGVIVFEMIAGRLPFQGSNQATLLYQHLHDPPPPLRQWRIDVPPGLDQIIQKAMAKEPEERYQSAGELARDLEQVTRQAWFPGPAPKPPEPKPEAPPELAPEEAKPPKKPEKRAKAERPRRAILAPILPFLRRWGWIPLGAVAIVALAFGAMALFLDQPHPVTPVPALLSPANAHYLPSLSKRPPRPTLPTPTPLTIQGQIAALCSTGEEGEPDTLSYWQWGQTEPTLWPGMPSDFVLESASWSPGGDEIVFAATTAYAELADLHRMPEDGTEPVRLTNWPGTEKEPVWSPDGQEIAFTADRDGNWDIFVMPSAGGDSRYLTQDPANDWAPSWNPDSQRIVFVSDRDGNPEIYLLNLEREQLVRLTNNTADDLYPVWSPSGSQIAFLSNREGELRLYQMDITDQRAKLLVDYPVWDDRPSWSPKGDWLAFTLKSPSDTPQIHFLHLASRQVFIGPEGCHLPAWRPEP